MNKTLIIKFVGSILLIAFISAIILFTKVDFPFAIFFLIPIAIYSIQKGISLFQIILLSIYATVVWIITYYFSSNNSFDLIVLFNAFLRFGIYFSISYLLFLLTKQRAELTRKNLELHELNIEKNSILGIAAHDIRNAAGAINSFTGILLEKLKSKDHLENEIRISSIINTASNNLLELVSNLLDLSKIESGQIQLNKIPANYNSFIEYRIDLLQIIAQQKNITITFRKTNDISSVNIDPVYLTEVIDNLISNAIKYSNPNSEIKVGVKVLEKWIRTEVTDFGIGIKKEELDGLFKPFYRTSNKPTSGEKSTGLGLAIAQKVIKLHGGDIGVESIVNDGSTFYFTLPL